MPEYYPPLKRHELLPGEALKLMERWDELYPAEDPVELTITKSPSVLLLGKLDETTDKGIALMFQLSKGAQPFDVAMTAQVKEVVMNIAKNYQDPGDFFKYKDKKLVDKNDGVGPNVMFRFVRC